MIVSFCEKAGRCTRDLSQELDPGLALVGDALEAREVGSSHLQSARTFSQRHQIVFCAVGGLKKKKPSHGAHFRTSASFFVAVTRFKHTCASLFRLFPFRDQKTSFNEAHGVHRSLPPETNHACVIEASTLRQGQPPILRQLQMSTVIRDLYFCSGGSH